MVVWGWFCLGQAGEAMYGELRSVVVRHVMAGMASYVGVRSVTFRWGRPG